jgi:hypothetical protein
MNQKERNNVFCISYSLPNEPKSTPIQNPKKLLPEQKSKKEVSYLFI